MEKLDISKAIESLRNGEIIVYPTDTLYGLGADIYNDNAVRKIFQIKKRPIDMPLSVAIHDYNELDKIAFTNDRINNIANKYLPGKITLILRKKECISDIVTAGLNKVAIRIPDNKFTLELLSNFGPITSTSANIHGQKTPGNISDIGMQFKDGDIAEYIDIGKLEGQPSTIIDMTGGEIKIIREGAISAKAILDAI
jgi:L-threonylcarbamoyladenylate synthase